MQEKAGSREEASVGIGSKLFGERTLSHVFSDLDSCVVHEDVATLGEICVGPDDTICASMLGGSRLALLPGPGVLENYRSSPPLFGPLDFDFDFEGEKLAPLASTARPAPRTRPALCGAHS